MIVKRLNNWRKIMKKITISDLDGFTDICECEKMLGELKAGCTIKTGEVVEQPKKGYIPADPFAPNPEKQPTKPGTIIITK